MIKLIYKERSDKMEDEIWKDIPGYEGRYKISNYGKVWSNFKKDFMSIFKKRRPTGQEIFNAVMTIITTIASLFCVTSCMSRF